MNKVIISGRLTKDPELRYSQSAEPVAVARYAVAVNRRFKREGEPDADFINCVAFGKVGEFAEKYFKKGMMVVVSGRLQVRSWDDQAGQKHWSTDVIVEEQDFGESRGSFETRRDSYDMPRSQAMPTGNMAARPEPDKSKSFEPDGFSAITESIDDDDLPF